MIQVIFIHDDNNTVLKMKALVTFLLLEDDHKRLAFW